MASELALDTHTPAPGAAGDQGTMHLRRTSPTWWLSPTPEGEGNIIGRFASTTRSRPPRVT